MKRAILRLTAEEFGRARINLGRVGEDSAVRIVIDLSRILAKDPKAIGAIAVEGPKGNSYAAVTNMDGTCLVWDVSEADVAEEGTGKIQLTVFGSEGEKLKSAVAPTRIGVSLTSGVALDPVQNWIDDATNKLGTVVQAGEDAEKAASKANTAAEAANESTQKAEDAADAATAAAGKAETAAGKAETAAAKADTATAETNAAATKIEKTVEAIVEKETPGAGTVQDGYMVLANGNLLANSSSQAYTGISVKRGKKVKIENAYCAYSRSICAYDADGKYVKTLGTNLGEQVVTVTYDVDTYDMIAVTCKSGEEIVVSYVDADWIVKSDMLTQIDDGNAIKEGTGNYELPKIEINTEEFLTGCLARGSVISSENYTHSGYIQILDEQKIVLENIMVCGFTAVEFYDKDKLFFKHIETENASFFAKEFSFVAPPRTKYIRFSVQKGKESEAKAKYEERVERNYKPKNIINRWYEQSFEKINTLFAKATESPICCIIDDDTMDAANAETFAALMEANGIAGTLAALTANFATKEGLKDKLLALERRGHQIVLHGYTQNEAYNAMQEIGDANYKIAEDDLVHGLRDLQAAGFCDYRYWVTPFGITSKPARQLAQKWGMECLVSTANSDYNGTNGKYGRYMLQRSGLNAGDTGALTYAELLTLADECAEANGWLMINTHIYSGWNGDFSRITEFITHCKAKGYTFTTLGEAWRIRKPIYEWYETF